MSKLFGWVMILFLASSFSLHAESTFYGAYQAGLQFEKAGKWKEAREQFLQASALKPSPARRLRTYGLNFLQDYDPYVHAAHCEFQLGMFEEAMQHLELSRKAGVTAARTLQDLKERIEMELRKKEEVKTLQEIPKASPPQLEEQKPAMRLATLKAESNPPGATVRIDGEDRGSTPLRITLPPGIHSVEYVLQGFQSGHETVDLEEAEMETVKVVLSPIPSQQNSFQQPLPSMTVDSKPPAEKETITPSTVSAAKKETESQAHRKIVSVPLQNQQDSPVRLTENMRTMLVLLMIGAVLGLLLLRTHRSASRSIRNPAIGETPTQDLRLESDAPARTPTPAGEMMLDGIRVRIKQLPQGTPKHLGEYEMMGVLGYGGMGTTFLAKRTRDGLPVALKIPHEHVLDDPEFSQRFLREGSLGSMLHHPNIIRILEANKVGNKPFITMELLEGETLEKKLLARGRLPVREALEIARDVALALDYARFKGIVHRDLKPENIMILDRGGLKVVDYGIAHLMDLPGLTSTGTFLGTPSYCAPESIRSGEIDHQSDLYSLGIVLYRCLTGSLPFSSDNVLHLLDMHRSQSLPPFPPECNIPDSVFRLLQKLTEKRKADRFVNAESFLVELNHIINQDPAEPLGRI